MKTRLLKRIRRRFEISYNENGIFYGDKHYESKFALSDKSSQYAVYLFDSIQDCKDKILKTIRNEYYLYSKHTYKTINKKIWYK